MNSRRRLLFWAYPAFVIFCITGCAYKPVLKTELDKNSGATIVSTEQFHLGNARQASSLYGDASYKPLPLTMQIHRTDSASGPKIYTIEVTADALSPRLNIQKENSLIMATDLEELKFSTTDHTLNDKEPMAEYFPAFRKEAASYSNISESDLMKIASAKSVRVTLIGDGRQEEVKLPTEIQIAVKALLPAVEATPAQP